MKKIFIVKLLSIILAVVLLLTSTSVVLAHPSSQKGILEQTYHFVGYTNGVPQYDYCVGGEAVGWCIDEDEHMGEKYMTYSFDEGHADFLESIKGKTYNAANQWSSIVTFRHVDEGGVGTITVSNTLAPGVAAAADHLLVDANGHTYSWVIYVRTKEKNENGQEIPYEIPIKAITHELGHIIGLIDLQSTENVNKLMYGSVDGMAAAPTASDRWGAKVITGQHTSHTWAYKYHSTTTSGSNRHVNYCTSCNGIGVAVATCIYNANNVCRVCGTPAGQQPWSTPHETE